MHNSVLDVKDMLDDYSLEIQESIEKKAQEIATKAMDELKNAKGTYTIRTGKYNKGWRVNVKRGRGFINCTVYNGTNWQLTHLLENGHLTRNGGRTRSFVHIRPVEEKYVNQFEQDVEKIIKNGG